MHLLFLTLWSGGWIFVALRRQCHWNCDGVCQQHADIGWVRVVSSVHLLFNLSDVEDALLLRCTDSGIRTVSSFMSNMLTLDR